MSKHFHPIFNGGIMENGVIVIDGAKIQSFIDNFLTPIVNKYNALTKDERRDLLTRANTNNELMEELLEDDNEALIDGKLSVGYLLGFLHNNYPGLDLDKLFFILTNTEYKPVSHTGEKRGRTLFENNNNNDEGPINPRVGKRLKFTGGTKKRKQRKSRRTMKKRN